jgi:TonB family protein
MAWTSRTLLLFALLVPVLSASSRAAAQSDDEAVIATAEANAARAAGRCVRESAIVLTAVRRLQRARTDAARLPLRGRLSVAHRALTDCMRGPEAVPVIARTEVVRIRARVTVGEVEAVEGEGVLDRAVVERVLRTRLSTFRACYESRLRENPSITGRVRIDLVIGTTGTPSAVSVLENTTGDSAVGDCVVAVVRRFPFRPPPTTGPAHFEFQLRFVVDDLPVASPVLEDDPPPLGDRHRRVPMVPPFGSSGPASGS